VASVSGDEFLTAVVARAAGLDAQEVEEWLRELEHVHRFVRLIREEELPDGTLTTRYRFVHTLYQGVLLAMPSPTRRVTLHGAMAAALLGFYRGQTSGIALQLAHLYDTARDFGNATDWFLQAARHAMNIFAYAEVLVLARRGLACARKLPETPTRAAKELLLLTTAGIALRSLKGYGSSEMHAAYTEAQAICRTVSGTTELFPVLYGLWMFCYSQTELAKASEICDQLFRISNQFPEVSIVAQAHCARGVTLFAQGDVNAREDFEKVLALYSEEDHYLHEATYGLNPVITSIAFLGRILLLAGYPDRGLALNLKALRKSQYSPPETTAFALLQMVAVNIFRFHP
jgi:adenylate cyclase